MTITIGLWVVPFAIMCALFVWASLAPVRDFGFFPDPMPLVRWAAAVIGALLVWLIWALAR